MSKRPRFEMRSFLTAWNLMLATFSIIGFARTLPEFLHTLSLPRGVYHSVCSSSYVEVDRVSGFWSVLFVLSKVPELGDTIFIILRKQPLIFLHWYHHLTVLVYSWYSFSEYTGQARWFIVMNYLVHSLMYSYYSLKAMRFRIPRGVAMIITLLQLSQMFVGCTVNYLVYVMKQDGLECNVSDRNIKMSFLMYISYFALFGHFFYQAYLSSSSARGNGNKNAKGKVVQVGVAAISAETTNGAITKPKSENENKNDRVINEVTDDCKSDTGASRWKVIVPGTQNDVVKRTHQHAITSLDKIPGRNDGEGSQVEQKKAKGSHNKIE